MQWQAPKTGSEPAVAIESRPLVTCVGTTVDIPMRLRTTNDQAAWATVAIVMPAGGSWEKDTRRVANSD